MAVKTKYTAIIEDEDGEQYMAVLEYKNGEQYFGGYYQKCKTISYTLFRVEIHDYGTYKVTDFHGTVESKVSLQNPDFRISREMMWACRKITEDRLREIFGRDAPIEWE